MAISVVGGNIAPSNSTSINMPSGVKAGDLLIMFAFSGTTTAGAYPTVPTGSAWVQIARAAQTASSNTDGIVAVKTAVVGEPGSYTFNAATGNTFDDGSIIALRSSLGALSVDNISGNGLTVSDVTITFPSVAATALGELELILIDTNADQVVTFPAGFTTLASATDVANGGQSVAYMPFPGLGATGGRTCTVTNTDQLFGFNLVVREVAPAWASSVNFYFPMTFTTPSLNVPATLSGVGALSVTVTVAVSIIATLSGDASAGTSAAVTVTVLVTAITYIHGQWPNPTRLTQRQQLTWNEHVVNGVNRNDVIWGTLEQFYGDGSQVDTLYGNGLINGTQNGYINPHGLTPDLTRTSARQALNWAEHNTVAGAAGINNNDLTSGNILNTYGQLLVTPLVPQNVYPAALTGAGSLSATVVVTNSLTVTLSGVGALTASLSSTVSLTGPTAAMIFGSNVTPASFQWLVLFYDDFNGSTIDTTKWNIRNDTDDPNEGTPEANNPANATVASSALTLTATNVAYLGKTYTGAMIDTQNKFYMKYGRVTFRWFGANSITGLWPGTVWATNEPEAAPSLWDQEIDFLESKGNTCYVNALTGGIWDSFGIESSIPSDMSTNYHIFQCVWSPSGVNWFLDGAQLLPTSAKNVNQQMALIANFGLDGASGTTNPATLPASFNVDYILAEVMSSALFQSMALQGGNMIFGAPSTLTVSGNVIATLSGAGALNATVTTFPVNFSGDASASSAVVSIGTAAPAPVFPPGPRGQWPNPMRTTQRQQLAWNEHNPNGFNQNDVIWVNLEQFYGPGTSVDLLYGDKLQTDQYTGYINPRQSLNRTTVRQPWLEHNANGVNNNDLTSGNTLEVFGQLWATPAIQVPFGTITLSGAGALAATVSVYLPLIVLSGDASAGTNAVVTVTNSLSATLSGVGALSTTVTVTINPSPTLSGVGALAATVTVTNSLTTTLSGVGSLAVTVTVTINPSPTLSGVGALIVTVSAGSITDTLSGVGALSATVTVTINPSPTLSGVGSLSAVVSSFAFVTWSGVGALVATVTVTINPSPTLSGVGALLATVAVTINPSPTLSGVGSLSANVSVGAGLPPFTLSGVGALSVIVSSFAFVTMSGAGSLAATVTVVNALNAVLVGQGSLGATVYVIVAIPALTLSGIGTLAVALVQQIPIPTATSSFGGSPNGAGSGKLGIPIGTGGFD